MKILMVCLGNICRSPLAQGIMEKKIKEEGLQWKVDSCGTGFWHVGDPPDPRSVAVAQKHQIDISGQRARQFSKDDFNLYNLILPMDSQNLRDIQKLSADQGSADTLLILEYLYPGELRPVPDPYYEGSFDEVYDMLDRACDKIIEKYR